MSNTQTKSILVDDMFLITDVSTTAGSKMLEGYQGLVDAEAITKAIAAGYTLTMKAPVGEFAIDLLGETTSSGAWIQDGTLKNLITEMFWSGDVMGAICFDVNGYPRRIAAQSGLVCLKPTYGRISRKGVISVAASGETVDVLARNTEDCRDLFDAIAEQKSEEESNPITRVAVFSSLDTDMNGEIKKKVNTAISNLEKSRISTTYIENDVISASKAAWNILLCAEICKNTARYDGVRYGHRAEHFASLDELYINSRTEGFGDLVKASILYGSEVLSPENYQTVYDKALRVRRVIAEEFARLFQNFDAVLLPACSQLFYTQEQVSADKHLAFEENRYTALATLTGLPAVVAGGVQLLGKANAEHALLNIAKILAGEGD